MPKYKILYHTAIEFNGHTIYRIEANRNFADVKAGDLGGYIESTENLSDEGDCWIYNDAIVCDSAKVKDNAKVCGNSVITKKATISGEAVVCGNSYIARATVTGSAKIKDKEIKSSKDYVYR